MKDLIIILPDIRSVYNVGSIIRTAAFFGAQKIVYCGYTPYPGDKRRALVRPGLKLEKVSLGAEKMLLNIYIENLPEAIAKLKSDGYEIVALELAEGAKDINNFSWPSRCALILGNEVLGLPAEILSQCAAVVQISGAGAKECLNVALATAIALACWNK